MLKKILIAIFAIICCLLGRMYPNKLADRGGTNMAKVTVTQNRYTTDSLYQWDLNQVLEITGLSLPSVPEIHFTNDSMDRAIVRQASMDAAGVVTVYVPNSLLQKPYKIKAYVCVYQGDSFKSEYLIEIPVVARAKPDDYSFEDDSGEIYSFNALENYVNDTVLKLTADWEGYVAQCEQAVNNCNEVVNNCAEAVKECKDYTDKAISENNIAVDNALADMANHNHEAVDVVLDFVYPDDFDSILSEQFDDMAFNSTRRILVKYLRPAIGVASGSPSFITLYKGFEMTDDGIVHPATATAQIVVAIPGKAAYLCEKNRGYFDTEWSELIWHNPPLEDGVEYATNEFSNGRRVYTMFLNRGALPNNGSSGGSCLSGVEHGPIIRVSAYTSWYRVIPYNYNGQTIELGVDGDYVWITTNYTEPADTEYFVQLWYLKP